MSSLIMRYLTAGDSVYSFSVQLPAGHVVFQVLEVSAPSEQYTVYMRLCV